MALPPERVDEALEMLVPVLGQKDVREAFEEEDADAVWLVDVRGGAMGEVVKPAVPVGRTWEWASVPG